MCGTQWALKSFGNRARRRKSAGDKVLGSLAAVQAEPGRVSSHPAHPGESVNVFIGGVSKALHEQLVLTETELLYYIGKLWPERE